MRLVVIFSGRVQGVGFRQATVEISEGFAVAGTVQNLANGDVELIAEGESQDIDAFIAAVEKRMGRYVQKTSRRTETPTQSYDDFSILR